MSKQTLEVNPLDVKIGDVVVGLHEYGRITVEREVLDLPDGTVIVIRYDDPDDEDVLFRVDGRWLTKNGLNLDYTDDNVRAWLDDPDDKTEILYTPIKKGGNA